jgi:hypothetical protein
MIAMLCRNRVSNFAHWKTVFDSHAQAHRAAGLHLRDLWREIEDPNNVFFLFDVADTAKAKAFINDPAAAQAGKVSGVLEGEYYFVESDNRLQNP